VLDLHGWWRGRLGANGGCACRGTNPGLAHVQCIVEMATTKDKRSASLSNFSLYLIGAVVQLATISFWKHSSRFGKDCFGDIPILTPQQPRENSEPVLGGQAQYYNDDGERAERSLGRFLQAICEIGGAGIDTKSFERRATKYLAKLVFKKRDFEDCGLFCRNHLGTFDHSYYKHEYVEDIMFVQTLKWEMGLDDDAVGISSSHKIAMLDTELIRPSV
jgi:hypothetical protein